MGFALVAAPSSGVVVYSVAGELPVDQTWEQFTRSPFPGKPARVLMPLPDTGFDPTEVPWRHTRLFVCLELRGDSGGSLVPAFQAAVPWKTLTARGHVVVPTTPSGGVPSADENVISGFLGGLLMKVNLLRSHRLRAARTSLACCLSDASGIVGSPGAACVLPRDASRPGVSGSLQESFHASLLTAASSSAPRLRYYTPLHSRACGLLQLLCCVVTLLRRSRPSQLGHARELLLLLCCAPSAAA